MTRNYIDYRLIIKKIQISRIIGYTLILTSNYIGSELSGKRLVGEDMELKQESVQENHVESLNWQQRSLSHMCTHAHMHTLAHTGACGS